MGDMAFLFDQKEVLLGQFIRERWDFNLSGIGVGRPLKGTGTEWYIGNGGLGEVS